MTGKKIRIALIGAGGMGKRWAHALGQAKDFVVRVVADVNVERAKSLAVFFREYVLPFSIFLGKRLREFRE